MLAQRTVRSLRVVLDAPLLNQSPCVPHRDEPLLVQAFVAESSVKALDVGILDWLAWTYCGA